MTRSQIAHSTFLLCSLLFATVALAGAAEAGSVYGDGVADGELTPIADILADPEAFDGRVVKVAGQVSGVCAKKGCWMELTEGPDSLRIKVEDDVIVFPQDATGKRAVAQGAVQLIDMSRERYVGWLRHLAEEQGETFDESSVGEPPYRLVQVAGTGARIEG